MSDDNVISLAQKTQRTDDWTPVQMMQWVLDEIESGRMDEPDALVLGYLHGDINQSGCRVGSYHARASGVLALSLFEMLKHFIVKDLFG